MASVPSDSGIENLNGAVDDTLFSACLERVLAQVDVTFSSSMIEAFWRSLKPQWLYLNSLHSIARLRALSQLGAKSRGQSPTPWLRRDVADLAGAGFGKPDVAVGTGGDAIGRRACGRNRDLGDAAVRSDSTDLVATVFREPEIAVDP